MTALRALEACYEHITVNEEVSWFSRSSPDRESSGCSAIGWSPCLSPCLS